MRPCWATAEKNSGRSPVASVFWGAEEKLNLAFLCVLCVLSGCFVSLGSVSPSHKKQNSLGFVHVLEENETSTIRHFCSLCAQQGVPPKTASSHSSGDHGPGPHHHALGTVLPHFWAATLLGLFIQWDLLQCHSAVDDVCTLRHVKRWYQPLVFSPKEVEGLSSSLEQWQYTSSQGKIGKTVCKRGTRDSGRYCSWLGAVFRDEWTNCLAHTYVQDVDNRVDVSDMAG